jgi:AraC-like DNA-binding protein
MIDPILPGEAAHRAPVRNGPARGGDTVATLLSAAHSTLDHDGPAAKHYLDEAIALLQGATSSAATPPADPFGRGALLIWQIRRVNEYILAHLDARIRTRDLAAVAKLSVGHFTRTFHNTFGITPMQYLIRQRVRRAQDLLSSTSESLSDIAIECGLCDQSHLTRVFRRSVGVTPGLWRRELRVTPGSGYYAGVPGP